MSRPIPASFFGMEQQFAHRNLVIKVKYGGTLRRISASVHGNLMDHSMSKLRAKIIDLFKFSNDADLILSYIDEDGDIVTLDNDDELRDAVIGQRLNPLRIDIQLKSTGGSDAKSESSSQAKSSQSDTLPIVDDPLKSIPEPFINVLSNLFNAAQNVVSSSPAFEVVKSEPFGSAMEFLSKDVKKAASFSPAVAHVVDQFSKVGLSNPYKPSEPTGDSSGGDSGSSTHLMHPYLRCHTYNENTPQTFHRGVQCDGCGMHPIVGPRFKSNAKEDYDLCDICFTQMGNENDYTKIERASHHASRLHSRPLTPPQNGPLLRRCGVTPPRAKLESSFIQDVTVLDGTVMPPLTHFIKIWRLRNNGMVDWPSGTQLVWVGGDQFGDRVTVDLEIPESGFPVDKELDVAVDFISPSTAGRYASYWRMASPSGQKFGQLVWVIIQVEDSRPNSAPGCFCPDLNLNLPPDSSSRDGSVIIDVNAKPVDTSFPEINVMVATEELVRAPAVDVPNKLAGHQRAAKVVGDLLEANDEASKSTAAAVVASSASSYIIDPYVTPSTVDLSPIEILLKDLEEMGFKQVGLNKEILRLNDYDLEQSIVDLCGFSEWDPLLSELNEMGFTNEELNKKLLMKNGGSVERVVMDLIAGMME